MTDEARLLKKKILGPNFDPTGLNQVLNEVFHHFLEFGKLGFLDITYNDSMQQCLTSSRGEIQEKYLWPKYGSNKSKLGPKLGFLSFSQA